MAQQSRAGWTWPALLRSLRFSYYWFLVLILILTCLIALCSLCCAVCVVQGKLWDWDPAVLVAAFPNNGSTNPKPDEGNKDKITSEKWDRDGKAVSKGGSSRPNTAIETSHIQLELDLGPSRPSTAVAAEGGGGGNTNGTGTAMNVVEVDKSASKRWSPGLGTGTIPKSRTNQPHLIFLISQCLPSEFWVCGGCSVACKATGKRKVENVHAMSWKGRNKKKKTTAIWSILFHDKIMKIHDHTHSAADTRCRAMTSLLKNNNYN